MSKKYIYSDYKIISLTYCYTFYLCIIQIYDSIPEVAKSNKFKVSKVTANIYNKTTGIKVTNDKIKD